VNLNSNWGERRRKGPRSIRKRGTQGKKVPSRLFQKKGNGVREKEGGSVKEVIGLTFDEAEKKKMLARKSAGKRRKESTF